MHNLKACFLIFTLLLVFVAIPQSTNAQSYFIKKNQPQTEQQDAQPAQKTQNKRTLWNKLFSKNQNNLVIKNNAETPPTTRAKTTITAKPASKTAKKTASQNATEQNLDTQNIKTLLREQYGPCTKNDLELLKLTNLGYKAFENQMKKQVDKSEKNGTYDVPEDFDEQETIRIARETGELPEIYKKVLADPPNEIVPGMDEIVKNMDFYQITQANIRCLDHVLASQNQTR